MALSSHVVILYIIGMTALLKSVSAFECKLGTSPTLYKNSSVICTACANPNVIPSSKFSAGEIAVCAQATPFRCKHLITGVTVCLKASQVCDSIVDCADGSDEGYLPCRRFFKVLSAQNRIEGCAALYWNEYNPQVNSLEDCLEFTRAAAGTACLPIAGFSETHGCTAYACHTLNTTLNNETLVYLPPVTVEAAPPEVLYALAGDVNLYPICTREMQCSGHGTPSTFFRQKNLRCSCNCDVHYSTGTADLVQCDEQSTLATFSEAMVTVNSPKRINSTSVFDVANQVDYTIYNYEGLSGTPMVGAYGDYYAAVILPLSQAQQIITLRQQLPLVVGHGFLSHPDILSSVESITPMSPNINTSTIPCYNFMFFHKTLTCELDMTAYQPILRTSYRAQFEFQSTSFAINNFKNDPNSTMSVIAVSPSGNRTAGFCAGTSIIDARVYFTSCDMRVLNADYDTKWIMVGSIGLLDTNSTGGNVSLAKQYLAGSFILMQPEFENSTSNLTDDTTLPSGILIRTPTIIIKDQYVAPFVIFVTMVACSIIVGILLIFTHSIATRRVVLPLIMIAANFFVIGFIMLAAVAQQTFLLTKDYIAFERYYDDTCNASVSNPTPFGAVFGAANGECARAVGVGNAGVFLYIKARCKGNSAEYGFASTQQACDDAPFFAFNQTDCLKEVNVTGDTTIGTYVMMRCRQATNRTDVLPVNIPPLTLRYQYLKVLDLPFGIPTLQRIVEAPRPENLAGPNSVFGASVLSRRFKVDNAALRYAPSAAVRRLGISTFLRSDNGSIVFSSDAANMVGVPYTVHPKAVPTSAGGIASQIFAVRETNEVPTLDAQRPAPGVVSDSTIPALTYWGASGTFFNFANAVDANKGFTITAWIAADLGTKGFAYAVLDSWTDLEQNRSIILQRVQRILELRNGHAKDDYLASDHNKLYGAAYISGSLRTFTFVHANSGMGLQEYTWVIPDNTRFFNGQWHFTVFQVIKSFGARLAYLYIDGISIPTPAPVCVNPFDPIVDDPGQTHAAFSYADELQSGGVVMTGIFHGAVFDVIAHNQPISIEESFAFAPVELIERGVPGIYDPEIWRAVGITLLLLNIYVVLCILRTQWEGIQNMTREGGGANNSGGAGDNGAASPGQVLDAGGFSAQNMTYLFVAFTWPPMFEDPFSRIFGIMSFDFISVVPELPSLFALAAQAILCVNIYAAVAVFAISKIIQEPEKEEEQSKEDMAVVEDATKSPRSMEGGSAAAVALAEADGIACGADAGAGDQEMDAACDTPAVWPPPGVLPGPSSNKQAAASPEDPDVVAIHDHDEHSGGGTDEAHNGGESDSPRGGLTGFGSVLAGASRKAKSDRKKATILLPDDAVATGEEGSMSGGGAQSFRSAANTIKMSNSLSKTLSASAAAKKPNIVGAKDVLIRSRSIASHRPMRRTGALYNEMYEVFLVKKNGKPQKITDQYSEGIFRELARMANECEEFPAPQTRQEIMDGAPIRMEAVSLGLVVIPLDEPDPEDAEKPIRRLVGNIVARLDKRGATAVRFAPLGMDEQPEPCVRKESESELDLVISTRIPATRCPRHQYDGILNPVSQSRMQGCVCHHSTVWFYSSGCSSTHFQACAHDGCGYTVCQNCVRVSVKQRMQGIMERLRNNPWEIVGFIALQAAKAIFLPSMQTAIMVLICHPSIRCAAGECYTLTNIIWVAAACIAVTVIILILIGWIAQAVLCLNVRNRFRDQQIHDFEAARAAGADPEQLSRDARLTLQAKWSIFVDEDFSAAKAVYSLFKYEYVFFRTFLQLTQLILAGSLVFTTVDLTLVLVAAGVELLTCSVIAITLPFRDPVLALIMGFGSMHQITQLGLNCLNRGNSYSDPDDTSVPIMMIVVACLFLASLVIIIGVKLFLTWRSDKRMVSNRDSIWVYGHHSEYHPPTVIEDQNQLAAAASASRSARAPQVPGNSRTAPRFGAHPTDRLVDS